MKKLFRPRQLPNWWLRFTESHPAVPNIIAVTGLASILFLLAPTTAIVDKSGHGHLVDSLAVVFKSEPLIEQATNLRAAYHSWVPAEFRDWAFQLYGNLALYFIVPFILLLEYLFPCNPSQPLIGRAFLQDAIWFAASEPTNILVLGAVSHFLHSLYDDHLTFLTISSVTAWPAYLQVISALLLGEFLHWFSHVTRHKVSTLWLFHEVHHSQKEMNLFTEDRNHVVDKLVVSLLKFVPFYIFQVPDLYAVAVIGLYISIHSRFVHANVKIDLGWLGWLLASPQFHRVHHSTDPAHLDKNFGGVLSIFDHLFGTAYPSRDIYPETGITDARFPTEDKIRGSQLPINWLIQTIYPFVQLFERLTSRRLRLFRGRVRSRQNR